MTQRTEEQYQELSRKVAEKFNITPYQHIDTPATYCFGMQDSSCSFITKQLWLYEDWHTIMELCVNHNIFVEKIIFNHDNIHYKAFHCARGFSGALLSVKQSDHNNDKSLAERIARMLALMEV